MVCRAAGLMTGPCRTAAAGGESAPIAAITSPLTLLAFLILLVFTMNLQVR